MNKKNKNKKNMLIILVALICIFAILLGLLAKYKKENVTNTEIYTQNQDSMLSDIINKLGSKFYKKTTSSEEGFKADIYLKFKYDLYENNKSQQVMYENLIRQVSTQLFENIRLIDEEKNIIIRVYYNAENDYFYYTVNGIENYFDKSNSKRVFNNLLTVQDIDLNVDSYELKEIINNNWDASTFIGGTQESYCDNYNIYFDEGIKIRNISQRIYNVVFTSNYNSSVVNGIAVGDSFKNIQNELGKPSFDDDNIIGYKSKEFYIFFSKNEISVYGITNYECDEFENILGEYLESKIDVKTFTNKLTDLWNNYSDFNYDSSYVSLYYPLQGISMNLNSAEPNNIMIYSNYKGVYDVQELIEDHKIIGMLDKDLVFETEKSRIQKNIDKKVLEHLDNPEFVGVSNLFCEDVKNNKVEFYSRDGKNPDCTLVDAINSYVWADNDIFVYSVKNKGIYYYDLRTREKNEILVEDESEKNNYLFKNYKKGILVFDDDREIKIME